MTRASAGRCECLIAGWTWIFPNLGMSDEMTAEGCVIGESGVAFRTFEGFLTGMRAHVRTEDVTFVELAAAGQTCVLWRQMEAKVTLGTVMMSEYPAAY